MKKRSDIIATIFCLVALQITSCSPSVKTEPVAKDSVADNIKMYTHTWDEILNHGKLDQFNDSNFTKDVIFHMKPANVIGIDSARAFYSNFITGFSNIRFIFTDVFGEGNKLVKHWKFKGKHTGNFFGIPATGKDVDLDGATIVLMRDGKIAEEEDFYDNLDMMTQLGQIPGAGK
jgi:steroid delta-isomerase-like uncharacterized protein